MHPDLQAFATAIERRRRVCETELGDSGGEVSVAPGAVVRRRMIPVSRALACTSRRVGAAGVERDHECRPGEGGRRTLHRARLPPQIEFGGLPHPNILALCHILGVDEVYAVGGAQAIAMFAYGVPGLCRQVDLITGPGNIYVVAAKRLLRGRVSIDAEAGPTEIAVLADATADPVMWPRTSSPRPSTIRSRPRC